MEDGTKSVNSNLQISVNRCMSSIHNRALSGRTMALELGGDPSQEMSFSCSGSKCNVDLEIDPRYPKNLGTFCSTVEDHMLQQNKMPDCAKNDPGSTKESGSLQYDTEKIKDPLLMNHQNYRKDCDEQLPCREVREKCDPGAKPDATKSIWPDWDDTLPPEDLDDGTNLGNHATQIQKTHTSKMMVADSNVVTLVESRSLQEEETSIFTYLGSSDNELEQGFVSTINYCNLNDLSPLPVTSATDMESIDSAEFAAANQLLNLGTELNCGGSKEKDFGDLGNDIEVAYASYIEKSHTTSENMVSFPNAVTFVEPTNFLSVGCSDYKLKQGADQVTNRNLSDLWPLAFTSTTEKVCFNSAEFSAACCLTELGKAYEFGDFKEKCFPKSSKISRRVAKSNCYNQRDDLAKLSELIENMYAVQPQLSVVHGSKGSTSRQVGKDTGIFRMKGIRHEKEAKSKGLPGVHNSDDDTEVLERPPWKQQYKSLKELS